MTTTPKPGFQLVTSREFVGWLAGERLSLALSTYHGGALIMLGRKPGDELSMFLTGFDRAMGLWAGGSSLWLATTSVLWRLENSLASGMVQDGFDRVYVPRVGYTTGDLDIHDLAIGADGRPVFVNTRFSCL